MFEKKVGCIHVSIEQHPEINGIIEKHFSFSMIVKYVGVGCIL